MTLLTQYIVVSSLLVIPYLHCELLWVTGQFRCATLELCNFDAKESNLCCFDGFCTSLCCAKADVILTGPLRTK